jgi:hypothetical protein
MRALQPTPLRTRVLADPRVPWPPRGPRSGPAGQARASHPSETAARHPGSAADTAQRPSRAREPCDRRGRVLPCDARSVRALVSGSCPPGDVKRRLATGCRHLGWNTAATGVPLSTHPKRKRMPMTPLRDGASFLAWVRWQEHGWLGQPRFRARRQADPPEGNRIRHSGRRPQPDDALLGRGPQQRAAAVLLRAHSAAGRASRQDRAADLGECKLRLRPARAERNLGPARRCQAQHFDLAFSKSPSCPFWSVWCVTTMLAST